jgi:hypothetical protein
MTEIIACIILTPALVFGFYTGWLWIRDAIANSKRQTGR